MVFYADYSQLEKGIMSDLSLSHFIRKSRKKKQITLAELANATGISYSTLVRLETGDMPQPHPTLLKQISIGLGMDYISLMELAGYILGESLPPYANIRCVECHFDAPPFTSTQEWQVTVANAPHTLPTQIMGSKWALTPLAPSFPNALHIGDILWMDAAIESAQKAVVISNQHVLIATRIDSNWLVGNIKLNDTAQVMGRLLGITYSLTHTRLELHPVTRPPFATY